MGKGDSPRPVDAQKYRENWERIFRSRIDAIQRETRGMIHGLTEKEALDDLTRMAQEDGLYGPTEGT